LLVDRRLKVQQITVQIAGSAAIYNERVAIILGLITLLAALATFASCRTLFFIFKFFKIAPVQNRAYQLFSRYHSYYWFIFGFALVAHLMMAIFHTGLPQAGDQDAGAHWAILILGFCGMLSAAVLFTTCKISPRLIAPVAPKLSLKNKAYRTVYQYHSYYWLTFALLIAGHFAISFLHAGIWPK
jgi:hypothetical protein